MSDTRIRGLASVASKDGVRVNADLSLLPPLSYLTKPFNRGLRLVLSLMWRFRWLTLTFLGLSYLAGLVVINIPMLEFPHDAKILVVMAPLILPLILMALYLIPSALLVTFFARNPKTRLRAAVLFCTLVMSTAITTVMSDTRLLLIIGGYSPAVLFLLFFLGIPWLWFRYRESILPHARWSTPVLVVLIAFLYWESQIGFSVTRVSPDQYTLSGLKVERPRNKHGVTGEPFYSVRMDLELNGYHYRFPDMPLPDSYLKHPETADQSEKQHYLEVRHSLFDHFTLR